MFCFLLLVSSVGVSSDEAELRQAIDASPSRFQLFLTPDSETPMKPLAALRWANNARGSKDGLTILYLHEGRPEAVAAIYPWKEKLNCGFDSLSRTQIVARDGEQIVWHPQKPGVEFRPVPDAPPPAKSRPLRLRQMKVIAKRFGSTMLGWEADDSDRESLRRLTSPLYRYETKGTEVLDGIVFAYALGTDPESLLLLEAVEVVGGHQWQYCFIRRTSGGLDGTYRGKVVWTAKKFPANRNPMSVHFTIVKPISDYLKEND